MRAGADVAFDLQREYYGANSLPRYSHLTVPLEAGLCPEAPFFPSSPRSKAEQRGVKYERQAQRELRARHGCQYVKSPWFWYKTARQPGVTVRYCQLDGLLIQPELGLLTIVEIKIQHTERAYFQTTNLYSPVVALAFRCEALPWQIARVEVCKWYDGTLKFPEPTRVIEDLLHARPDKFNAMILRPSKE